MPVPDSDTTCGLLAALSVKLSVPVSAPVWAGEKKTSTLQCLPGANIAQALVEIPKSPLVVVPVMYNVDEPVFVSVRALTALFVSTPTLPKLSEAGEIPTVVGSTTSSAADPLAPLW